MRLPNAATLQRLGNIAGSTLVGAGIGAGANIGQQASTGEGLSWPQIAAAGLTGAVGHHYLPKPVKGMLRGLVPAGIAPYYMMNKQKRHFGFSMLDPKDARDKINGELNQGMRKFEQMLQGQEPKPSQPTGVPYRLAAERPQAAYTPAVDAATHSAIMERARRFAGAGS